MFAKRHLRQIDVRLLLQVGFRFEKGQAGIRRNGIKPAGSPKCGPAVKPDGAEGIGFRKALNGRLRKACAQPDIPYGIISIPPLL